MSAQRLWNRRINKKAVGETADAGDPPGWRDRPNGTPSVRLSDEAASAPSRRSWLGTRSKHQWLACQQEVPATMGNISVRGWSDQQLTSLKEEEASRQGISMNRLVLQRLTMGNEAEGPQPGELDALAGTWSEQEADAFMAAIAPMGQVDPELWA